MPPHLRCVIICTDILFIINGTFSASALYIPYIYHIINCKHEQVFENNRQVLGIEPRFLDCRSSVLTTALQPPVSSHLFILLVVLWLLYYVNCIFVDGPD